MILRKKFDIIQISIRYVFRVKKRFSGIFFSIALGIAGLILLVTMGSNVEKSLNADLELLGGATVIKLEYRQAGSASERLDDPVEFTKATTDRVKEIPGVMAVTILTYGDGLIVYNGEDYYGFTLLGVDQDFWAINTVEPVKGRFFSEADVAGRRRICVLGEALANQVFGTTDVVGTFLQIREALYEVVGILGGPNAEERVNNAYIPYTTINDRMTDLVRPRMYVRTDTWDNVPKVAEALVPAIAEVQSVDGLDVDVALGPLKHLKRMIFWVQAFIVFSICTSIFIGGFGIWNGMMASVKSRTREIGLKKAMGGTDNDIMLQFLTEALTVTLMASIMGILLGRIAVEVFCYMLNTRPDESLFFLSSAASFLFSLSIGFVAGWFPAFKASRMDVVSAIRYE